MYLAVGQEIQQRKILKHETAMASDRDAGVGEEMTQFCLKGEALRV